MRGHFAQTPLLGADLASLGISGYNPTDVVFTRKISLLGGIVR